MDRQRPPPPRDFRVENPVACYLEFDTIMLRKAGPTRTELLGKWAEYWGPALTNAHRPTKAPSPS